MPALIGIGTFVGYMLLIAGLMNGLQASGVSEGASEALVAILLGCLAVWARRYSERLQYQTFQSEISMPPTWFALAMLLASPLAHGGERLR
jgi:hypothetical protein